MNAATNLCLVLGDSEDQSFSLNNRSGTHVKESDNVMLQTELDTDCVADLMDPFCNREHPVTVTPDKILKAQEIIRRGVVRTPCTRSQLSDSIGVDIYFKKEQMQVTGSFKDRGALNVLMNLTEEQKKLGVITTSAGNHSQAMAYQAAKLDIPVTVVMPETAPFVKIKGCKKLGGIVELYGGRFDEAKAHALHLRKERGLLYIDGFDHPDVIAGQGTIGLEIMEDVPDADYVIIQIGGGGLVAGVSAAIKHVNPNVTIIGVESERCPGWHTACKNGGPARCFETMKGAKQSLSDGLNVIRVGYNAFATAKIDKLITVPEKYFPPAILHVLEGENAVVEGAGAAGYAALLSGKLPETKGKKVVCILSGGNIDANVLVEVIKRGLVMEGRLSRIKIDISDRPGELIKLLKALANLQVNIKDIQHERASRTSHVYMASVTCTIETRDKEHALQVRSKLSEIYHDELKWELHHNGS